MPTYMYVHSAAACSTADLRFECCIFIICIPELPRTHWYAQAINVKLIPPMEKYVLSVLFFRRERENNNFESLNASWHESKVLSS